MDAKQVVVAYDFSGTADVALERAVDIACRAPAHVLHFIVAIDPRRGFNHEPHGAIDLEYTEKIQARLLDRLQVAFGRRSPATAPVYFVHARIGHPIDEILGLADDVGADMIIIGSHGRTGIRRLFLGSTSEAVVRRAQCPVIVARPKGYAHIDLDKIIEVPREPGHRHRRGPHVASSKVVGPMQWPT
jgi:nucleotide-binding universal stress UspA family protein